MQAEMLELSRYRTEKAEECLSDSQAAFDEGRLATSINEFMTRYIQELTTDSQQDLYT